MANVTEKDIIDHLKEKIKFHEKEVKRIEGLMSAFMGTSGLPKTKIKAEAIGEAKEPLPGKTSKKAVKSTPTKATGEPLTAPDEYKDSLTHNEKIAFALKEIGSGYNEDIAKYIAAKTGADEKKISKQISGVLSALKTTGKIKTTKEGRRDKYSLA